MKEEDNMTKEVPRGSLSVCVSVAVALYTVEKVTYSTIRELWG